MSGPMKVPLLDLKAQFSPIKTEIESAMAAVLESQAFILGPQVKTLEDEIAKYCKVPHAISCASGSDALVLALMALDIKPGDEVICPSYTFFATGGAVARLGARPVFADIDPATYNVSPLEVVKVASRCKRLKAIIPVHLFGQCASNEAIAGLANDLKVPFIEDAAQAIGSEDEQGRRAGSVGAMGCYSFFPSKNLGCFGDGGMMSARDNDIAERLKVLRVHGSKPKYYHKVVGINSRLDTIQAAVLSVKLKYLDGWTAGRQKNAGSYDKAFASAGAKTSDLPLAEGGFPLRTPLPARGKSRHIYNQYVVRVPAALRDKLREHLQNKGIGNEVYYPVPLHLQECFRDLGYQKGSLPHSETAALETIALPIYPELTPEQIHYVVDAVVDFLKTNPK